MRERKRLQNPPVHSLKVLKWHKTAKLSIITKFGQTK